MRLTWTENNILVGYSSVRIRNWFIIIMLLIALTACKSGVNNSAPTMQKIAIEKIANYAQNGGVAPDLQDYLDAGITGVDTANITEINTTIEQLTHDDVDTEAEIQALADSLSVGLLDAPSLANAAEQVYNENEAISALSFKNSGGDTLTSCTADTLPAGLIIATSTDSSTCEITGTPTTVQSVTAHTVTATNAAGNDTATVSIEVKAVVPPLALPVLENVIVQTYTKNSSITKLTFTNNGGHTLTSCTADTLPAGLIIATSTDLSTCEITGTPTTVQPVTAHTITATNAKGSDTAIVNIEVKAVVPPLALPALDNAPSQSYTKGIAISELEFTNNGGGTLTSCTVDTLPIGLSVAVTADTSSCMITGTPTVEQTTTTHTITVTNGTGNDTATVSIEVKAVIPSLALPALDNAPSQSYIKDMAISIVGFINNGGGLLTTCTASTLPAGLIIATSTDTSTCEITGTPTTVQSATFHTITATNATGSDVSTISIEVKEPVSALTLPNLVEISALTYIQNETIFKLRLLNSGGGELSSCSADSLPAGLVIGLSSDATTCEITGSPQVIKSQTTYSIIASNATGNSSVGVNITIEPIVISTTSQVLGNIRTITGGEIKGASIKVYKNGIQQPLQTTSDIDGKFTLALATNAQFTITFSATGYANQVKRIKTLGRGMGLDIILLKQEPQKNVPKSGGVITGKHGAKVTLPIDAFVDLQGNELNTDDSVRLTITPLDISSTLGVEAFPGDFMGVPEGETVATPIISYGTTEFSFTRSSDGKAVQLRSGQLAVIELPIYSTKNMDGSLIALGDFIPLWSLNEVTGVWEQEGSGEVVVSTRSPTGFVLRGEVAHFTWWNVDIPQSGSGGSTLGNVTVFANEQGVAVIHARQADSAFGAWIPESNAAYTIVGVSNELALPAGSELCLWADITFFSGKKASTNEVCVTPEKDVPIDINLGVDSGILFIHAIPANNISVVQSPVHIKLLPYTAETSVDFSIVSGSLPEGLILKSTGNISATIYGATNKTGVFNIIIKATDSDGNTDNLPLKITILDSKSSIRYIKKTGAVSSYNGNGFKVFTGLLKDDAFYQKGVTPFYTRDNIKQTVIDNITGLEWQDDNIGEVKKSFDAAPAYCLNLVLGGMTDWRLPTKKELESIVNFTKEEGNGEHHPYPSEFQNNTSPTLSYWSSLPFVNNTLAFTVNFSDGTSRLTARTRDMNVRCVRGLSSVLNGVFSKVNGVVTDSFLDLQWKDDVSIAYKSYEDAIDFCEVLSLNGKDDWRLPNANELLTVMDSHNNPAINSIFKYPLNGSFVRIWSSTPGAGKFDNGKIAISKISGVANSSPSLQSQVANVMCVRSDY